MKKKVKLGELFSFMEILGSEIQKNSNNKTKLQEIVRKYQETFKPYIDEYTHNIDIIKIKYARTDENGVLIEKDGKYQYTKDDMIKLIEESKKFQKEFFDREVEINIISVKSILSQDVIDRMAIVCSSFL